MSISPAVVSTITRPFVGSAMVAVVVVERRDPTSTSGVSVGGRRVGRGKARQERQPAPWLTWLDCLCRERSQGLIAESTIFPSPPPSSQPAKHLTSPLITGGNGFKGCTQACTCSFSIFSANFGIDKRGLGQLTKEYVAMQREPPPFVWAVPDEKNILTCEWHTVLVPPSPFSDPRFFRELHHCTPLLLSRAQLGHAHTPFTRQRGPPDSPFAGGEFHGVLLFPSEYPFRPPGIKVRKIRDFGCAPHRS